MTSTFTVLCFFIMTITDGSMNVRLANAAEDNRKVSADVVFFERTAKEIAC